MLHKNLHFIQHFELGKDQTAYGIDKKKKKMLARERQAD